MTDALVLSGGNIRGAYQAGVIAGLNAAWLAAFPNDGEGLAEFWRTRITAPDTLVRKRGFLDLAYRVVAKRWKGVVDTDPMAKLVREVLGPHLPVVNPTVQTRVGAVNLRTGQIVYYASDHWAFLNAVIASTAEPVTMPLRQIGVVDWYYDGGLRDIAPLKQAISLGATRIVVVLCQPPKLSEFTGDAGDVLKVASRVVGIVSNEILENDIQRAEETNAAVRMARSLLHLRPGIAGGPPDLMGGTGIAVKTVESKREIDIRVIRPAVGFRVDVASFTARDIQGMVEQGRMDGQLAGEGL
jgi:NTE family protein